MNSTKIKREDLFTATLSLCEDDTLPNGHYFYLVWFTNFGDTKRQKFHEKTFDTYQEAEEFCGVSMPINRY